VAIQEQLHPSIMEIYSPENLREFDEQKKDLKNIEDEIEELAEEEKKGANS